VLIADDSEHCLFHLRRRVDMKCVKLERRKLWREVQTGLVDMKCVKLERRKLWREVQTGLVRCGGGFQVAVRWWIPMTGVVFRVSVLSEGGGGWQIAYWGKV
jgi:hypothetical protein